MKIILPVINILKKKLDISGPYPSDTTFFKDNLKKFDVIVGMYHDQVLAPLKLYLDLMQLILQWVYHTLECLLIMVLRKIKKKLEYS